jgi:4-hydroxy-3-polyprenylbenzoate decarboxylase
VCILPPSPGFYFKPTQLSDIVDFVVARILDQAAIEHRLQPRWGE